MRIFMDFEYTGLHQEASPISIGLVSEDGRYFYGEFTDFEQHQVTLWVQENVINNLVLTRERTDMRGYVRTGEYATHHNRVAVRDNGNGILLALLSWFSELNDTAEMWGDCLAYDWVLFCQIFGGAFKIPPSIYYIPFDICTLFKLKGIDPDISREEFAGLVGGGKKHNALHDALVIKACYEKAMKQ